MTGWDDIPDGTDGLSFGEEGSGITKVPYRQIDVGSPAWKKFIETDRQQSTDSWKGFFPDIDWLRNEVALTKKAAVDTDNHTDMFQPHHGFGWHAERMLAYREMLEVAIEQNDAINTALYAGELAQLMVRRQMKIDWEKHALRGEKVRNAASDGGNARKGKKSAKAIHFLDLYHNALERGDGEKYARRRAVDKSGLSVEQARRLRQK